MRSIVTTLGFLAAAPVFAACPSVPDISVASTNLILELRGAEHERAAKALQSELWRLWLSAPDGDAQALLDRGIRLLHRYHFEGADAALTALVDYCPDYAEGYNQRAFSAYLQADYERALIDLDLALERNPTHLGALSGKAMTLIGMGRMELAQRFLRDALSLNPWLPERRYLIDQPGAPL